MQAKVNVRTQAAQELFDIKGIRTQLSACMVLYCLYLSEMVHSSRLHSDYYDCMLRNTIHYNHRTKMESICTMVCFQNKELVSNVNVKIMPIGFCKDFYCFEVDLQNMQLTIFCSIIRKTFICRCIWAWWVVWAVTICCVRS